MQEIINYQKIDSELRKLENELVSSKNRKGAAEMQQYLKDGQNRIMKLEEAAKGLAAQYEKAIALYNDFISKLEQLAKNAETVEEAKAEELETAISNFMNTSEVLENNINILGNKISAVNKEFEGLMNNAKKAKHNLEIYKANYNAERQKLEPEITKLKSELAKQKSKVEPALLAKYNAKSESKLFPIFVPEAKGRCGGCRMEIPAGKLSDLKSKGAIECENCGRFIYAE